MNYQKRVAAIAAEIIALRPGTHPKSAIREAKVIARLRSVYRVPAEAKIEKPDCVRFEHKEVPSHIRAPMVRVKRADAERSRLGIKGLQAKMVRGGTCSSK